MKIVHIISSLDTGGAELMLKRIVQNSIKSEDLCCSVISLTKLGAIGAELQSMGVDVKALNIKSSFFAFFALIHLILIMRKNTTSIVQTWMYHADLLGGLASFLSGNRNIVWNVRGTSIPQKGVSLTRLVVKTCAILSRSLPKKIVCCAEGVKKAHVVKGYMQSKMIVINNGYNLGDYHVGKGREEERLNLAIKDDEIVIGIVGRFDALKDYDNFILAANELLKEFSKIKFLMIGKGVTNKNYELTRMIENNNSLGDFLLMGESGHVNKYLSAMDIYCMSSSKEGFPNVVCEAMAMQIPCVVTNAGDVKNIVGDTGIIVPIQNSSALAAGLKTMINYDTNKRLELGRLARIRIGKDYSIEKTLSQYKELYKSI